MRPDESFVQQPIRSLQTMLRVLSKEGSSLPIVVPDGIYGPTTMQAVSTFQRQNGLPVTGVTDQQTWDEIVEAYDKAIVNISGPEPIEIILEPGQVFRNGDTSPYIYLLQAMLTQLSNDHSSITRPELTGIIDDTTILAIKSFQKLAGLYVTGDFDRLTWKHLVLQFTLNANHSNIQTSQ